jgi:F-type H+-transporting ATPase subunit a
MTLAMGLIAFLFIHGSGIAVHGLKGYWTEDLANPPLMAPMKIIIECFVPVSLSMRLFGNIFGGEMLLTVMQFPIVAVPFMILELLFGFIQAVIFFMLTLIFTSLATHLPGGHGEGRHAEGHTGRAAVAQGDEHASAGAQHVAPAHT